MTDNEKILLLGHEKKTGLELVRLLLKMGLQPKAEAWETFSPRAYGRRPPRLVIADVDTPPAPPMRDFAQLVRKFWGRDYPILALSRSDRFRDLEMLLDAGASDFLNKASPPALIAKKIARCLQPESAPPNHPLAEDIPPALAALFLDNPRLVRLGDLVGIYPGATPRRPWSRRHAPPDRQWRGVVTAAAVERFHVGKPREYLFWNRLHLFRMPLPAEYAVPEKVLLPRYGPPLLAAVDREGLAAGADVFSLVPRDGVGAGYVAGLLNSRLVDFYCHRFAAQADGRLRLETLRDLPVPKPDSQTAPEFARAAAMLTHFGPNPESGIDRQSREEWLVQLENLVAGAYGAGHEVLFGLKTLHF